VSDQPRVPDDWICPICEGRKVLVNAIPFPGGKALYIFSCEQCSVAFFRPERFNANKVKCMNVLRPPPWMDNVPFGNDSRIF